LEILKIKTMKKYFEIIRIGVVIWAVAFVFIYTLVGFKGSSALITRSVTIVCALLITFLFAKSLNVVRKLEMLKYVFILIAIGLILDMASTMHFTGWGFFAKWHVLVSYALSIPVSLLAVKSEK